MSTLFKRLFGGNSEARDVIVVLAVSLLLWELGVRILKPSTVRLMSTDQLDAKITERNFLPGKGSVGFGMDFAVRVSPPQKPQENRGAVGEFFWDGAWSTLFWVDPANKIATVFFVQSEPYDGSLHRDIRRAVYGDDYLGPKGDETAH